MLNDKTPQYGGQLLTAVLYGVAGSGLLFTASLYVPFFGFFATIVAPSMLGHTFLKGGRSATILALLITTVAMASLISPGVAAWYLVQCGLIAISVAELASRGFNPVRNILWTTAISSAAAATLLAALTFGSGSNPQLFIEKEIRESISTVTKLYESAALPTEELDALQSGFTTVGETMLRIYPALATIHLGVVALFTLWFFIRAATASGRPVVTMPLKEFRAPTALIWVLILAGFTMLLPNLPASTAALNLLVLVAVIFFVQGVAVLLTLAERTNFSASLKFLLTVLLITQPYLAAAVAALGIFDYWGDYRTPKKIQEKNL